MERPLEESEGLPFVDRVLPHTDDGEVVLLRALPPGNKVLPVGPVYPSLVSLSKGSLRGRSLSEDVTRRQTLQG